MQCLTEKLFTAEIEIDREREREREKERDRMRQKREKKREKERTNERKKERKKERMREREIFSFNFAEMFNNLSYLERTLAFNQIFCSWYLSYSTQFSICRLGHVQCDQMVRLFFNIWPFATMKINPIM